MRYLAISLLVNIFALNKKTPPGFPKGVHKYQIQLIIDPGLVQELLVR